MLNNMKNKFKIEKIKFYDYILVRVKYNKTVRIFEKKEKNLLIYMWMVFSLEHKK